MIETIYRKYNIHTLKIVWFNDNPNFVPKDSFCFYSLRQSVKLNNSGHIIKEDEFYTAIIDLTKNLDEIWKNFDKKSTRYEIKKAMKNENKITILEKDLNCYHYNEFFDLGEEYYLKKYGKVVRYNVNEILRMYDKNHILLLLSYENEFICGLFYIYDNKNRIRLLYSFSKHFINDKYRKLSGFLNRYLHWYAIKKFKEEGFKIYDFGGVDLNPNSKAYNITRFKLSFGGALIKEYNYLLHRYPKIAQKIFNLRKIL